MEMGRWQDALADYNKAIELYPDFAKAYMNRAYVENMLGLKRASKADYETARKKIAEYRSKSAEGEASFADTTRKYSSLLALMPILLKRISMTSSCSIATLTYALNPSTNSALQRRMKVPGAHSAPLRKPAYRALPKFCSGGCGGIH